MDNNEKKEKKVYIVTYAEKEVDEHGDAATDCGVFDYSYESLDEAKAVLVDCAARRAEILDCVFDCDCEFDEDWNEDSTWVCISAKANTYVYEVKETILI